MSLSNVTESFSRHDIQQRFGTNSVPTGSDFHLMIDNTLNRGDNSPLTGSYNHQHLRGQINMSRGLVNGKFDEFHEICPPFVPNLHPYIKVFTLDGYNAMHVSQSVGISNIGSNTGIWEFTYGNGTGADIRASNLDNPTFGGDFKFGGVTFRTSGTNNNVASLITAPKPFSCKPNKPWWIKTRFRINDYANTKWFFGLDEEQGNEDSASSTLLTTGASKDKVGFFHLNNTTSIKGVVSKNTNVSTNITFDSGSIGTIDGKDHANYSTDGTVDILSLAIYWSGTDINFYMDKSPQTSGSANLHRVHTFNTADNIPDDSNLRLVFKLKTAESSYQQVNIESIQGAITRA